MLNGESKAEALLNVSEKMLDDSENDRKMRILLEALRQKRASN
jgi:hypothetical protein